MKRPWVLGYPSSAQRRLIRLGTRHFVGFVILWHISIVVYQVQDTCQRTNYLSNDKVVCWNITFLVLLLFIQTKLQDARTTNEPQHDKTNEMTCAPSKDSVSLCICSQIKSLRCVLNGWLKGPKLT